MGDSTTEFTATDGHVYRVIEIVGSSPRSVEAAIAAALGRAHSTLRNLRWFEVIRTSGPDRGRKGATLSGNAESWIRMEAAV
jgi:flavin-binding protein dodecin